MRVLITGATGTIGLAVADALRERGDTVVALSRDPERGQRVLGGEAEVHAWAKPTEESPPAGALRGADAVIHLLGEPVAQRWTDQARQTIRDSRVLATRSLVSALTALPDGDRPRSLVSQSATGYYGPGGTRRWTSRPPPATTSWPASWSTGSARPSAPSSAMRVVCTRTGVVLSPTGGRLAKMLPFFRLGVGGPVAGGDQYVPWIHLDDVVGALLRCVDREDASGPVNLTAPNPVTNAELSRALGRVLGRPAVLPVPGWR